MALNAGNAACSTGLSKRIYDNWIADSRAGFSSPLSSAQADSLRALAYGVAKAVVDEIAANGEAYVGVALGALQQAGGVDTTGPTAERSIPLR